MTPERWSQIKDLFFLLSEQSPDERPAGILAACGDDVELQQELQHLLAQYNAMGSFLEDVSRNPTSSVLRSGDSLCRRYEIIRSLGSGGMGEVYEAYDRQFKDTVALKVIRSRANGLQQASKLFLREAQLARKVTHRNVCRIFDIGSDRVEDEEIVFLTMEFLRGETLSARIQREGKIQQERALSIALQLCSGLEAVHQAGVLHRDLKPSNIMLVEGPGELRAVLTDFGIGQWLLESSAKESTASALGPLATPAYASPEQLQGKPLTMASDIYSLGLVFFEMITGTRPFQDRSIWIEAIKRIGESPSNPSSIVPGLQRGWDTTVLGCLQSNPEKRFNSAAEVQQALKGGRKHTQLLVKRAVFAASLLVCMGAGTLLYEQPWRATLPVQKHIAVLPFEFSGQDRGEEAEAYGVAESLATDLEGANNGNSLWVVPWTEVQKQVRDQNPHIGRSLGVNLLLSGSLDKHDRGLRVRLSIRNADTLKELRSSRVEIKQGVSLDQVLAQRALSLLEIRIGADALRRLAVDESTTPGAYEFYAQGRGYLARRSPENTDLAITLFQTAVQKDASFAPAYAELALAYSWKYRDTKDTHWYTQAEEACRRALALNPDLVRAHIALGSLGLDSGKLESSIREFESALQREPNNNEARNLLARAYDAAGRPLQAESVLKDALKRNPGIWINYNDLGYFYYRHAQYAQAEPLFRTATELAPDNPRPLADLGGVYLALGKYESARQTLTRAVSVKPSAGALSNLGTAEFYLGRYPEAASLFQKAVALRPGDSRLWRNVGDALYVSGRKDYAAKAYEKAVELARGNLAVHSADSQQLQNLAVCYAKLGKKIQAESALAQAPPSAHSDPEFLFASALVYELNGKRKAALAALRSAIRAGYSPAEVQHAVELSDLRTDPRYAQLDPGSTTTR